jgi:adenylate kinase
VYAKQTQPLIEYYQKLGLLRRVDAEGSVEDVFARIERVLNSPAANRKQGS